MYIMQNNSGFSDKLTQKMQTIYYGKIGTGLKTKNLYSEPVNISSFKLKVEFKKYLAFVCTLLRCYSKKISSLNKI